MTTALNRMDEDRADAGLSLAFEALETEDEGVLDEIEDARPKVKRVVVGTHDVVCVAADTHSSVSIGDSIRAGGVRIRKGICPKKAIRGYCAHTSELVDGVCGRCPHRGISHQ